MTRSSSTVVSLPIDERLEELCTLVKRHPVTLIEAAPGAGKTTRVPPALVDAGLTGVLVLEPRRIAARMAAARVADERGEELGGTVGYQVRFESRTSRDTKLTFLTEGVFTRRFLHDQHLNGIRVVVLDEFHERHLDTDVALALVRQLQHQRADLRLVIMSATLDSGVLRQAFPDAPLVQCEGRVYPLDIRYTPYSADALEVQATGALERVMRETEGHVLIFLPGAAEIRRAMETSQKLIHSVNAVALPLHGELPPAEQDRAVRPSTQRKVIFSTNVAESSVTIEGVRVVIDSGLARVASWSPWTGIQSLRVEKISWAAAIQRAGRAGRTGPGLVVRLYSEEDFRRRAEQLAPEILRADLTQMVLDLAAADLRIDGMRWMDAPPNDHIVQARTLLMRLRALTESGDITPRGREMARIPLHPRLACVLLNAADYGAGREGARIAALLSEGRVRLPDGAQARFGSDVDALLAADLSFNAQVLERLLNKTNDGRRGRDPHAIDKALLAGFPDRVARLRGETLLLSSGGSARLDGRSATRSEFVCALEIEERAESRTPLVRIASPVEPEWLLDFFVERAQIEESLVWDRAADRVDQVSTLKYDALVVDETKRLVGDTAAGTRMLVEKAVEAGVRSFVDGKRFDGLTARIRFARENAPGTLPSIEELERVALTQLAEGLRSFSELRAAASNGTLEGLIEAQLPASLLDEIAPEFVKLPSGRRARIEYPADQPPWVASRLQDFFGMKDTPRVGRGAVPVVAHLLAPNQRPVQLTQDLASFWKNLYPQVRRELSRRYPRHRWPENPYVPED